MAVFSFPLDSLLSHRIAVERKRQREVAQAHTRVLDAEWRVRELATRDAEEAEDMRFGGLVGRLDATSLASHSRYHQAIRRQTDLALGQLELARKTHAEAHSVRVEASRQRQLLQRLREIRLTRFVDEQSGRMAVSADEISMRIGRDYQRAEMEGRTP